MKATQMKTQSYKLPRRGKYCVYDTDLGRIYIESADVTGFYCIENISQGESYMPRNKAETKLWLERHAAQFISEE
jgi:hypothetical protein